MYYRSYIVNDNLEMAEITNVSHWSIYNFGSYTFWIDNNYPLNLKMAVDLIKLPVPHVQHFAIIIHVHVTKDIWSEKRVHNWLN